MVAAKPSSSETLPCGRVLPTPANPEKRSRDLLAHLRSRLDAFVTEKNLNRSEAREKILEAIADEAHHFTAQGLLDRLRKRFPEVGKATLYRNLPVFVESGVLQEGPTDAEGQTLFEVADEDHHDHIVCTDCQRIFEFHDEEIEARQASVAKKMRFQERTHRHVIYAACEYLKRGKKK